MNISPTQDDVMTVLRAFMLDRLPGVDVIQGIENRVAEPTSPNFAVLTLMRAIRLATNIDTDQDVKFTGTIAPGSAAFTASIQPAPRTPAGPLYGLMAVSAVGSGAILTGARVGGAGPAADTFVTGQVDGTPGGVGTYTVSVSQDVLAGPMTLSYGLMNVTAVAFGTILVGANVFGVGVASPTTVRALGTGAGLAGTYIVDPTQTFGPGTLSAGGKTIRQNSTFTVQIDFHSQDATTASDMAQTISASFRDAYAVDFINGLSAGAISPLFADDPRFAPFPNENQQFERRWILDANLQVNQTIRVPAQFADFAEVTVISVDTGPPYPP